MPPTLNALSTLDTLFHADPEQIAVLRFTAMHGERFRLRDPADIQRFLATVGRLTGEVVS
jgi:hypothetical protein